MLAWGGSICWVGQGPVGYVGPGMCLASISDTFNSFSAVLTFLFSSSASLSSGFIVFRGALNPPRCW